MLATLATTLDALLRLFAPFIPFATEEVWSWWRTGSVHRAAWPTALRPGARAGSAAAGTLAGAGEHTGAPAGPSDVTAGGAAAMLATVGAALSGIRKAKSEAKVKQRTEVLSASISAPPFQLRHLEAGLGDLKAAGNAREITLAEGPELAVSDVVAGTGRRDRESLAATGPADDRE